MNTIQVHLNDKQFTDLLEMLKHGEDQLDGMIESETDEECLAVHTRIKEEGIPSLFNALTATKTYLWSAGCIALELEIGAEHVDAIAVPGDNEVACHTAIKEDGYLRRQLEEMDLGDARDHLRDAGIEEVEKKSDEMVRIYLLWMACHDINEERHQED